MSPPIQVASFKLGVLGGPKYNETKTESAIEHGWCVSPAPFAKFLKFFGYSTIGRWAPFLISPKFGFRVASSLHFVKT